MVKAVLSERQEALLAEERRHLGNLRVALAHLKVAPEDQATLEQSIAQLDELFLLVVVGEFNSGKSALINALLGRRLLPEGVTPTTTRINLLKYGSELERTIDSAGIEVLAAPNEMLRQISIVDTPGTNAIYREHEVLTQRFVPRADIVLFVTSADRPFTESERLFLQSIRNWGKKVIVVVNKIDILESAEDVAQVESFIADNARSLLGFVPQLFPVSARLALRAKEGEDGSGLLAVSRFEELERYIVATLDERERVRLKLLNPLGVGQNLLGKYIQVVEGRLDLLQEDMAAIEDIERQLEVYKQDMVREFRFRLADVDNALHELENRGLDFFDETVRLGRVFDLLNKAAIKAEFERKVVGEVPQLVDRRVADLIDWLVASDLRQWQAVMDHLSQRRAKHAERIVGQVGGSFDYDRTRLLDTVGRIAREVIDSYDQEAEAAELADSVQMAVAGMALAEVGAVGLGTAVALLATTTLADVTGLAAASMVAALGLFIIPVRRNRAKKELKQKIATMREQLMGALTRQFEQEMERSLRRINEAIAPYTRFVRAERGQWSAAHDELTSLRQDLAQLALRIEAM